MLRSTKKEVKEKIRAYILENIDFSNYLGYDGYPTTEPETSTQKVLLCYKIFSSEYGFNIKRMGEYRAFSEWLQGLPSALTIDFSCYDVRKIVARWLEQTEEEANKYNDIQVWEKFLHLITREFFAMVVKARGK